MLEIYSIIWCNFIMPVVNKLQQLSLDLNLFSVLLFVVTMNRFLPYFCDIFISGKS